MLLLFFSVWMTSIFFSWITALIIISNNMLNKICNIKKKKKKKKKKTRGILVTAPDLSIWPWALTTKVSQPFHTQNLLTAWENQWNIKSTMCFLLRVWCSLGSRIALLPSRPKMIMSLDWHCDTEITAFAVTSLAWPLGMVLNYPTWNRT